MSNKEIREALERVVMDVQRRVLSGNCGFDYLNTFRDSAAALFPVIKERETPKGMFCFSYKLQADELLYKKAHGDWRIAQATADAIRAYEWLREHGFEQTC